MDRFLIEGGRPLRGAVRVSGSKNAALPILIATLLTDEPCEIQNVPRLRDMTTTFRLLGVLGKKVRVRGDRVRVESSGPLGTLAPYDLVKQMRASVLVAGPLLARFGRVRFPLPGGCAIGLRPIDIHLKGFERMGARVSHQAGDLVVESRRLRARKVRLRFPSVGATENLLMAAARTPGMTVLSNCAREPEIADLADFLGKMGAGVSGAGGSRIEVEGRRSLRGAVHRVIPDRLETGTFLLFCAAAGGRVRLERVQPLHVRALLARLKAAGARVRVRGAAIEMAWPPGRRPKPVGIRTEPYPGFPTDLQAPWMALMCRAAGRAVIREDIFERRFLHAAELARMGGHISVDGRTASVQGVPALHGAPVMASDIRAGAALLTAALSARGRTEVQRVYHIDRGYQSIEVKLRSLGARIKRLK